jgi:hypothetical protein
LIIKNLNKMKLLGNILLGLSILLIIPLATIPSSCIKDTSLDSILTTNTNGLQLVLTIPNGSLTTGTLPVTSTGSNIPTISFYQTSASTGSGYQLLLPFQYTSSNGWKYIYIQIVGATNGYYKVTNPGTSTNSGTIALPINIPGQVLDGTFTITFSIVDVAGLVSVYKQTTIVIKPSLECVNANNSGSEGLTFTQVDLGSKAGSVSLNYDTYSVPDRVDVFQGSTWLGGTGVNPGSLVPPLCNCSSPLAGFVGRASSITFNYNPSSGRIITIVVSGCLGGGTAWVWNLTCP